MLDTLGRICDEGGRLVGVSYAVLGGEHPFVTAVALRFETLTAVFRAVPDDDTLTASVGPLVAEPDEVTEDAGGSPPWAGSVGLGVRWGWRLTNQQGYTDGVRLEFTAADESSRAVAELVTVASGIQVFAAVNSEAPRTRRCT